MRVKKITKNNYIYLFFTCLSAAGVNPSTLHPPDWKTGLLWESLWGEFQALREKNGQVVFYVFNKVNGSSNKQK